MQRKEDAIDSSLKFFVKSTLFLGGGLVISKLLSYLYRVIIAREFGPEEYGVFMLALAVTGWFVTIASLGLSDGTLRYFSLSRGKGKPREVGYLYRQSNLITLISSCIMGFVLFILADPLAHSLLHTPTLALYLKFFSLAVPLTALTYPLFSLMRAYERATAYTVIFNIIQNIPKFLFLLLFISIGMSSGAIIHSYLLGIGVMLCIAYWYCKKKLAVAFAPPLLGRQRRKTLLTDLLKYSIPLVFFSVLLTLFYWTDTFMLGYFKSAREVGIYNAAITLGYLIGFIGELFMQFFFARITQAYARKELPLIKELSKQIGKWIFVLEIPIFILLIVFPGAFINIIFGSEFLAGEMALRIGAISMLIYSLFNISNQLISMTGRSKLILADIFIVTLLNIILNWLFIPREYIFFLDNSDGMVGAALATLISIAVLCGLFAFQAYRQLGILPLRRKMINISCAALISLGILIYLKSLVEINYFSIVLLGCAFVLFYILLALLFKGIDRNDQMIITTIKHKLFKQ